MAGGGGLLLHFYFYYHVDRHAPAVQVVEPDDAKELNYHALIVKASDAS